MSPAVRAFLEAHGLAHASMTHAPLVSFEDAKRLLPHDPAMMVKALAFRLPGDGIALCALRAADRADYRKIADALGVRRADLALADPQLVRERLDMEPGGIVPLPIAGARVLADARAARLATMACGSGRNTTTLVLAVPAWLAASGAAVADLAKADDA